MMESVMEQKLKCDQLLEELESVLEASRLAQQDVPHAPRTERSGPTVSSVPVPPVSEPRTNRSPSQNNGMRTPPPPPPPPRPPPPPPRFALGVLRHSPLAQKSQSSGVSSPQHSNTAPHSTPPGNSNSHNNAGSPAPKKPPPPPPSPPPPPPPAFSFTTPVKVRTKPPSQTPTPEPTPPTPHQQHQQPLSNGNSRSSCSSSTGKKTPPPPPPPPRPPPPPPPLATPSPMRLKVKAGGAPTPVPSTQCPGASNSDEHLNKQQQQNGPSKPTSSPSPLKSPATPGASSASEFRALHWEALPANQATTASESVWNNPLVDVLDIKPISKLELFTKAQAPTPVVRIRSANDGRQQVLDSATSNNLLIQFQNMTPQALASALERMDRNILTGAYVQQCLSVLSKEATVEAVQSWTQSPGNDISKLGPAEMFVHVLVSAPHAQLRLEVLRLSHSFQEDLPRKVRHCNAQGRHLLKLRLCGLALEPSPFKPSL
ncbi:hypothetical protein DUNSADRAFT_8288 [Dunaliella salina]|uniref:FH2 domain-containing protein n=1 Tax=Dunaliella salina TaxID=3046 RepID=A0ABQ7HA94_DUNSA|nr:hypothetical protein DUNSADRAFT_8288 [Dunaliella salina]|eukprot:KAF5843772.1 hypothetical protein DUNSADRAFT_8288 [Dunaliella salina]